MSEVERLMDHLTWANRLLVAFIHDHGWTTEPARLMSHVVLAEAIWHHRITGVPADRENFRILPRFEVEERIDRHDLLARRLLQDHSRNDRIAYHRFSGDAQESSVGEILLHLITHSCHHRGQITAHYAREGCAPPAIDFMTFASSLSR